MSINYFLKNFLNIRNEQHFILFTVFRAKRSEMDWVVKRSGLNVEHAMDDGCVRLRGLPFGCPKDEISTFFAGMPYYRVI